MVEENATPGTVAVGTDAVGTDAVAPVPMLPLEGGTRRGRRAAAEPAADWRWVEEWRRGGEPVPWGPGLFLAAFAGLIIGCAVYVITTGLSDNLALALGANVVVAVGLTPALWMSRGLPVLRWVALGGAGGTLVAWISLLFFPHVR